MTNDTSTLNGALSELGETMADNLVSMGVVDASASDGLTTLAGKILDIEPSIGGLDLDTAVTISSSESSISLGSSIVLTSKLTASYDDETIVDVDLSGVLQNATLIFKNGNTTIGTAVTDVNGVATFTYTPPSIGTLSLKTIFAGTDNFNNCESSFINVTVVAPSYDDIVLTADDSILSYYDGDSTTLRAQLMDGSSTASVSGVTVEFFNGSTSMGTAQTDSNGVATKTYTSAGVGDVEFTAEANNGTLVSETYELQDNILYDDASSDKTSNYTNHSNYRFTHQTDHYELANNYSSGGRVMGVKNLEVPSSVVLSYDVQVNGTTTNNVQPFIGLFNEKMVHSRFTANNNEHIISLHENGGYDGFNTQITSASYSFNTNTWYTVELTVNGSQLTLKAYNTTGTLLVTLTGTSTLLDNTNEVVVGGHISNGKIFFKNLKIKPL